MLLHHSKHMADKRSSHYTGNALCCSKMSLETPAEDIRCYNYAENTMCCANISQKHMLWMLLYVSVISLEAHAVDVTVC